MGRKSKYTKIAAEKSSASIYTFNAPKAVEMINVPSTNLSQVGYKKETSELIVFFKDGTRYTYIDIPASVAEKVIKGQATAKDGHTPSWGAALDQYVKKAKYSFVKG